MEKIKYIFLIIIFIFVLTGCETHKEISDLGMVSAMGIEKKDDKYLISVQVANIKKSTKMGTDNSSKVTLYTGTGNTCFEAIREISTKSSKKLYFPHIKIIVIDDDIINENPEEIVDFFARDNEGNMNAYILVSKENTPSEILSTIAAFEDVPAEYIYNSIMLSETAYGNTHILKFDDFINYLIRPGIDPIFTKISLTSDNNIKNNTETLNSINLSSYISLGNLLVFDKNNKLVELTKEESIAFNIINSKESNSIITLKCSSNDSYYTLELMNNKSSIDFDPKKNNINIYLNLTYSISDYNCGKSLLNKDNLKIIKNNISNKLEKDINTLLKKSIDYESDFMGFGLIVRSTDKNYFDFKNKNWSKEGLSKIKFNINIKINLENRGDLINIIKKEGKYE